MATVRQFVDKLVSSRGKTSLKLLYRGYGIRSNVFNWQLQLLAKSSNRVICSIGYPIDSDFVSLMMELGGYDNLLIQDNKKMKSINLHRYDLYKLAFIMGEKSTFDVFRKVIEKTIQREKYLNFPIIRKEYENARSMLRDIRREIYTLFRFFTDSALKHAALSALGSSKNVNNDTVKLQQVINRILNYHDDMATCVERITKFENDIENKKLDCGAVYRVLGSNHDDCHTVSIADVLEDINAARIGYYQRTKSILN